MLNVIGNIILTLNFFLNSTRTILLHQKYTLLVTVFIKNCEQYSQASPQILHPPLCPLISLQLFQIIEVDFYGPLPLDPVTDHQYFFLLFFSNCKLWYYYDGTS